MTSSFSKKSFGLERETPSPDGEVKDGDVAWDDARPNLSKLAGFDFAGAETQDRSGLYALINSAFVAHRKLPMLDVVFDRAARGMSRRLRQLADENVEVTLEDVASTRFGDFLHAHEREVVIGVARSAPLEAHCLIVAESALILAVVDLLLGGRRGLSGFVDEGRAFTAIELSLAGRLFGAVMEALNEAFQVVYEPNFRLDRIETSPRFAAIAQEPSVCALAKLNIGIGELKTRAYVLMPHGAIEPIRELLMREFSSDSERRDDAWRARLDARIRSARLDAQAVLARKDMTIGALAELKVGDVVAFRDGPQAPVSLSVGGRDVAAARLGRLGDRIALRLLDAPGGEAGADEKRPAPAALDVPAIDAPREFEAADGASEGEDA